MDNRINSAAANNQGSTDGTKIYLPTGQKYTLGEFLSQVNNETKMSDDEGNTFS